MKRIVRVEVERREPGYMEAYIRQDGFVGIAGALRGGPEHDVLLRVLPDEQAVEPCPHGAAVCEPCAYERGKRDAMVRWLGVLAKATVMRGANEVRVGQAKFDTMTTGEHRLVYDETDFDALLAEGKP